MADTVFTVAFDMGSTESLDEQMEKALRLEEQKYKRETAALKRRKTLEEKNQTRGYKTRVKALEKEIAARNKNLTAYMASVRKMAERQKALAGAKTTPFNLAQMGAVSPTRIAALAGARTTPFNMGQMGAVSPARMVALAGAKTTPFNMGQMGAVSPARMAALAGARTTIFNMGQMSAVSPNQLVAAAQASNLFQQTVSPAVQNLLGGANNNAPSLAGQPPRMFNLRPRPGEAVFRLHDLEELKALVDARLGILLPEQQVRFMNEFKAMVNERRGLSGSKLEAQDRKIANFANQLFARDERRHHRILQGRHKIRARDLASKRIYGVGYNRVTDQGGLFDEVEFLINTFGGKDAPMLRKALESNKQAILHGDTLSVAPTLDIKREMQKRLKAQTVAKGYGRYRGGSSKDPWVFMTHDEAYKEGMRLLDDLGKEKILKDGKTFAAFSTPEDLARRRAELTRTYNAVREGREFSAFQTQVRNIKADAYRYTNEFHRQGRESAQLELAQNASRRYSARFLGVEQPIFSMDKNGTDALINQLEIFAQNSPNGRQYRDAIAGLRRQNRDIPFEDVARRQGLGTSMRLLASRMETNAKYTPGAYYALADFIRSQPNAPDKMSALQYAMEQADLARSRNYNWHYQTKALQRGLFGLLSPVGVKDRYDDDGYWYRGFGLNWGRGSGWAARFRQTKSMLGSMLINNPTEFFATIKDAIVQGFMVGARMLMPVAMIGGGVAVAGSVAAARYGISSANRRQSLQTMYDVSIPNSWKHGMSYDEFERENFSVARDMRTNAYALQENALRLATAVNTARYSTGARAGQPIVTDFQDVMRMSRNMAILARISGVSDSDLAAFMLQIQQGIGKGKLDTMDIKPMENRSPMMANLWAQKFLGLSGAAEMFKMMDEGRGDRTKGITPEKFLPRMASKEVEQELMAMLRSTARTWDQVFTVVGSDLQQGMLNFTKRFQEGANGRLGSDVLGMSQYIAEEKLSDTGTLGDIVAAIIPSIQDLPKLLTDGIHKFGAFMRIASDMTDAVKGLVPLLTGFGSALLLLITGVQSVAAVMSAVPAGIVRGAATAVRGGSFWEGFKGGMLDVFEVPKASIGASWELFKSTGGIMNALDSLAKLEEDIATQAEKIYPLGKKDVERGGTEKPMNVEDSGLTGTTAEIAKDTKEIKKNGAKLTSIQLELLKQVSGRAVINNMTRVAPNIVANVGTIKSGVEYEQFMADLNKTVRLASMNMAY